MVVLPRPVPLHELTPQNVGSCLGVATSSPHLAELRSRASAGFQVGFEPRTSCRLSGPISSPGVGSLSFEPPAMGSLGSGAWCVRAILGPRLSRQCPASSSSSSMCRSPPSPAFISRCKFRSVISPLGRHCSARLQVGKESPAGLSLG